MKHRLSLFPCALTAVSALCLGLALELRTRYPDASGPALLPLVCGVLMLALSVYELIKTTGSCADRPGYPVRRLAAVSGFLGSYLLLLYLGAGFYLSSGFFLFGLMTYLRRGKALWNLLIAACFILACVLLFTVLLKTELP